MGESYESKQAKTVRRRPEYLIYSVGDEGRRILFLEDHQLPLEEVIAAASALAETLPFRDWIVVDHTDGAEPIDVHVIEAERISLVIPGPDEGTAWRLQLFCTEAAPFDENGWTLQTSDGVVLDRSMFRHLRERTGAWIQCHRLKGFVANALRSPAEPLDWEEAGIGRPAAKTDLHQDATPPSDTLSAPSIIAGSS